MPAEDISQVLLRHPATRQPCDEAEDHLPFRCPGWTKGVWETRSGNPLSLVTSVTEGDEYVGYQLSQGWSKTGSCNFCRLGTSGLTGNNSNFINPNIAVDQLDRQLFPIKFLSHVCPCGSVLSVLPSKSCGWGSSGSCCRMGLALLTAFGLVDLLPARHSLLQPLLIITAHIQEGPSVPHVCECSLTCLYSHCLLE